MEHSYAHRALHAESIEDGGVEKVAKSQHEAVRERLAAYYNIDLTPDESSSEPSASAARSEDAGAPELAINAQLRNEQWAGLRRLAEQWKAEGDRFRLLDPEPIGAFRLLCSCPACALT